MSLYTTGEIAKRCKVSVRTVQYYDERGILIPAEISEGGRRLFSEENVKTLETICFLRDLDISIKDIAEILESAESKKVIEMLLDRQANEIQKELERKTKQLEKIKNIKEALESFDNASEKSIHDISAIMVKKNQLKKMYRNMVIIGAPLEAMEIATFVVGILKGIWIPFGVTMAVAVACVGVFYSYWYKRIGYICPECHTEFKPKKMEAFLAKHTQVTRKVTCPCCNRKVWCLEMFRGEEEA